MTTKRPYTISENTDLILNAIEAVTVAKDALLAAYTATYGEEQGQEEFVSLPIEDLENAAANLLYMSVTENLCTISARDAQSIQI